jgi:prepilin-type N-terminal cleavage/methylation domain-containing protein
MSASAQPNHGRRPEKSFAFTLIELLVVIAIIAILASMLLPTIARSLERSRTTICINNLHQLSVGAMNYSLDQNGRFPNFRSWLWKTPGDLTSGELYKYVGNRESYLCPTDKREIASRKRPAWATIAPQPGGGLPEAMRPRDYSYSMSCGMCHAIDTALFRNPSKTMLFMEAYVATNDYTGRVGPQFSTHALALRHGRRGNLIMTDLHVEQPLQKQADTLEKYKIFWFPTEKTDGPNGMNFGGGLL